MYVKILCTAMNANHENNDHYTSAMDVEFQFVMNAVPISIGVAEEEEVAAAELSMHHHQYIFVKVARKMNLKSACRAKRESARVVLM